LLLGVTLLAAACGNDKTAATTTSGAKAASTTVATGPKTGPAIAIGSANFGESQVLAEIYAGALEAKGYKVERKLNIGSREVYFAALEKGDINFFAEYAATSLEFVNKGAGEATADADATTEKLKKALDAKGLTALKPAPGQDQNAIAVTKATADKLSLKKISDLKGKESDLVFGGPPECPTRPFCLKGLEDKYGLKFKDFKALDSGGALTVAALDGGEVQVALLFSSSGVVGAKGFVLLEDDKKLQLADNVVPVVSKKVTDAYGADFATFVDSVSAKITTQELIDLNKRIDIDKEDFAVVAKAWLKEYGFTK
jgi:osmoprotectant transport system substrate-binding protein